MNSITHKLVETVRCIVEANILKNDSPFEAPPESDQTLKLGKTSYKTRREILSSLGMNQSYFDQLAARRAQYPKTGETFALPSIAPEKLDAKIKIKSGPRGSHPSDASIRVSPTAGGWAEGPNTIRVVLPEWNPVRNLLAHESTHALQDPSIFDDKNPNVRVAGPIPGDTEDTSQSKERKNYLFNKVEPAARANEYKTRVAEITGRVLSPNASSDEIKKFTDDMLKISGEQDSDVIKDVNFYSTPEGAELLRQAKNEKKSENNEHLAEFVFLKNNSVKSFKQFLTEKWSAKYKRSINCTHPKGFSQRAHCAGRKKN